MSPKNNKIPEKISEVRTALDQLIRETQVPCKLIELDPERLHLPSREKHDVDEPPCVPCDPPDMMVCYRIRNQLGDEVAPKRLKLSKSRELRGGILYRGCDCERLNGLQDDCRRSECFGSADCLTGPEPCCGPSEFSNGKHLKIRPDQPRDEEEEVCNVRRNTVGLPEGGVDAGYHCFPAYMMSGTEDDCCPMIPRLPW